MVTQPKIKILAVGSQIMLHRLTARLDQDEISLKACTSTGEIPQILEQEHFDVVIIDDLFNDTEAICQNASQAGKPPVAVLFRKSETDWKKLRTLDVDGFFPDEAGRPELMARIRAFSRRRPQLQVMR
jgi:DNA-binding response OmpR family regulator